MGNLKQMRNNERTISTLHEFRNANRTDELLKRTKYKIS